MIGLFPNGSDGFFNKNLLKAVNMPIFNYIFKLNVLFPPILKKNVLNLSNSNRFLPVNCAVDDLEFYQDENSQIYDLLNNPQFYSAGEYAGSNEQPGVHGHIHPGHGKAGKKDDFIFKYPTNIHSLYKDSHHKDSFSSHKDTSGHRDSFEDHTYYEASRPIEIGSQSSSNIDNYGENSLETHFNLNIVGSDGYYFNDFKPHQDNLDYYSSSNESYVSPLDEELFKKREVLYQDFHNLHNPSVTSIDFDLHSEITDLSESIEFPIQAKEPKKEEKKRRLQNTVNTNKKIKIEDEEEYIIKTEIPEATELKYQCSFCSARFKVKGYLTRHLKKHQSLKAFKCPFYREEAGHPTGDTKGTKCHPTGGFSRRDTFKTHLKALHFIYPPGTKSTERSLNGGRCAGCFTYFKNNVEWLETHIEKNKCPGTVVDKTVADKSETVA